MSAFDSHPAYMLALHAINGATNHETLDDIADLCEMLWQRMRPALMDATDLAKLEQDIEKRREAIEADVRAGMKP